MALSDIKVRNAASGPKPKKLFDGEGLYLEVSPSGGKWWRLKYRYDGKEKRLSLGVYPAITLAQARVRRNEAREQLAHGIDPSENRKAEKLAKANRQANTFEAVTREWFAKRAPGWAEVYSKRLISRFEQHVFPWLGERPVAAIEAHEILAVVRRIEDSGALETAHRTLSSCGQVFRYAVSTQRRKDDPASFLRGALPPARGSHLAAITDPARVAELLRAIDGYHGTLVVRCALRLAPLVFVRPGELRKAKWADMYLDTAEWRFKASKKGPQFIVPLSMQAVEILQELQPLTGKGEFVFPNHRSCPRPMSENAILTALRDMGIPQEEMCGHGFRAMARTILDEVLGVRIEWIELQLAHAVKDPNGTAYNRTAFLPQRRTMMQQWADYLDKLKGGTHRPVIVGRFGAA
jgi:integrase